MILPVISIKKPYFLCENYYHLAAFVCKISAFSATQSHDETNEKSYNSAAKKFNEHLKDVITAKRGYIENKK